MDESYQGIWRMDWGFGNPNKTAAFIAVMMVAVWGLAYIRKWGFWASLTIFTGLGVCLLLTQSRGGLVGMVMGSLIVLAWASRPFQLSRILALAGVLLALVAFALIINAQSRYAKGLAGNDRSVENRLLIWKQVPAMIHDAPNGWGLGKSGDAYMQWYQPITRGEGYRTLVNSHFTWIVELNWWGRIAYIVAWIVVLVLIWPHSNYRWLAVPFAIWIALVICSAFSSVAEVPLLWVIPLLALVSVLVVRFQRKNWPSSDQWLFGGFMGIFFLAGLFLWETWLGSASTIYSPSEGIVTLGSKSPCIWIIAPNRMVLGEHYGHEIRRGFDADPIFHQMGCGFVSDLKNAPLNQTLVLSGQIPSSLEALHPSQTILINPPPAQPDIIQELAGLSKVTVVVGEYSRNKDFWRAQAALHSNIKLQIVEGSEEYISNWMREVAIAIKS